MRQTRVSLLALIGILALSLNLRVDLAAQSTAPRDKFVPPKGYICCRADRGVRRLDAALDEPVTNNSTQNGVRPPHSKIAIDGRLDEPAWRAAPWTDDFVDIEGDLKPPPRFRTRVKMLWDDEYFYIGVELDEPHVWATLTKHDSVIFQDNDFEVFVDPNGDNHNYGEFEINALNTGWDLRLTKPYKDEGKADDGWNIAGIKTAVHIDGTLNDPRDTDRGWSIEIAVPWSAVATLSDRSLPVRPARRKGPIFEAYDTPTRSASESATDGRSATPKTPHPNPLPAAGRGRSVDGLPRDGDQWRVNFSRVEWRHLITPSGGYSKVAGSHEDNWVWSPQWTINMHRPETWGYVQFSTAVVGTSDAAAVQFRPDHAGAAKHLLHHVYYAQRAFRQKHGRYAATLDELGVNHEPRLTMQVDGGRFEAVVEVRVATERWHIADDSRVWKD